MGKESQPLQFEMFTGALIDNRTRTQKRLEKNVALPQQMTMFSLRDTVQIGVAAHPWLNDLPRPQMTLVSEDPRTDEEKNLALLREAQKLTNALFAVPETPDGSENGRENRMDKPVTTTPKREQTSEAHQEIIDTAALEIVADTSETPKPSKEEAHTALLQITKEYAMAIQIAEAYRQRFYNQLPIAILEAQAAGLTPSEITTAMQEGDLAGNQGTANAVDIFHTRADQTNVIFRARKPPNSAPSQHMRIEGHRAKARRTRIRIRYPHRRISGQHATAASVAFNPDTRRPHDLPQQ
jgi:hypothetical protein